MAVTLPRKVSISSSVGSTAIALDFASTASCPKTSRCSSARALTGCSGEHCSARLVARTAQGFPVHRQYAGVSAAFGQLPHKADEPLPESGGIQNTQEA